MELLHHAGLGATPTPSWYQRPTGVQGWQYLLRLEQQLAVACSALAEGEMGNLTAEHEILAGTIDLNLAEPGNATVRMLLAQTLRQMKKVRAGLLAEYKARVDLLQQKHPIGGDVGAAIQRSLEEAFAPSA